MKTNRSLRAVRFAVLALMTVCFGAGLANAQEVKGTFELPFEVHWGQAVLAPGAYSFRLNFEGAAPDTTVVVRDEDKSQTIILASTRERKTSKTNALMVERHGNRGIVHSLQLGNSGLIIYFPAAKVQPPVLAEGPKLMQRIPILVAQK